MPKSSWPSLLDRCNPLLLALPLCAAQVLASWPGGLIADSREQLHEAISGNYADWHPPVMALVWSWLIRAGGAPGSLLLLHQILHWLGFGLIADGCRRAGLRPEAWLVLLAGAFPLFLFYDRIIIKDVGMASALVAAAGIALWFVLQRRRVPPWAIAASAACLAYGALVRTNGVFAIGPLLLMYRSRHRAVPYGKILVCAVLAAAIALPVANWVNHRLIGARAQYPQQSLQIFDLMGVAVLARDPGVFGPNGPSLSEIEACYTPYWWDPASPWGICQALRRQIGFNADIDGTNPARMTALSHQWRAAILRHPIAYLVHRLEHFNASEYFFVPAYDFRFSKSTLLGPAGAGLVPARVIALDYLRVNLLCWPVFWLALGVCGLALLGSSRDIPVEAAAARLLASSGLLFSCGYFVVGVATDVRYHYWTAMSVLVSLLLASRQLRWRWQAAPGARRWSMAVLVLVALLGYAARIGDVPLL